MWHYSKPKKQLLSSQLQGLEDWIFEHAEYLKPANDEVKAILCIVSCETEVTVHYFTAVVTRCLSPDRYAVVRAALTGQTLV